MKLKVMSEIRKNVKNIFNKEDFYWLGWMKSKLDTCTG